MSDINPARIENKAVLADPKNPSNLSYLLEREAGLGFKVVAVSQIIDGMFWVFFTKEGAGPRVDGGSP